MKCKNCNIKEAIKYSKCASGNFCSKKCACGFSTKEKRLEINKIVSKKMKGQKCTGRPWKSGYDPLRHIWTNKDRHKANIANKNKCEFILNTVPYEQLGPTQKRKYLLREKGYKCEQCSINEWNDKKIIIEYHHIDGNNKNWKKENIKLLCPNCHSQTNNWRRKTLMAA